MIFNCGESWQAEQKRLSEWHPFFALLPHCVGIRKDKYVCAWLEFIERKGEYDEDFSPLVLGIPAQTESHQDGDKMTDRQLANYAYSRCGIAPRDWADHYQVDSIYGSGFLNHEARQAYLQIYNSYTHE